MQHEIVAVVASRRGIAALRDLLSELPSTFGAPVVCLAEAGERLREELQRHTRLRVRWAEGGERLEAGCVYLPRPGSSLVCRSDGLLTVAPFGPESSGLNPVDQFLTSIAMCHGERALALVLAGFDRDGVAGAQEMKRVRGSVLVLDRATAAYWGVAEPMVRAGHFDRVLTAQEVAEALRACFTSRDLLRCAEIQVELRALLDTALGVSRTTMGHIQRLDPDTARLRVVVQRGVSVDFFEAFDGIDLAHPSAAARAVGDGRRVVVEDVFGDAPYAPLRDLAAAAGFRAEAATPLVPEAGRSVVGILATLFEEPHVVTPDEARDLDGLARTAARVVARFP